MSRKIVRIGRDPHNDIRIDDKWDTVSNLHGEILCENGDLTFTDHSSNGTVINGQKIHNTSVGIYPGDTILLANAFDLDWDVIRRFFPELKRPTVIRNVRAENHNVGRRTVQKNVEESPKGRSTERFVNHTSSQHTSTIEKPDVANNNFGLANEYTQSQIDAELEKWNWGAFFCSWLWGVFNGIYWPVFIILIVCIPYLGQVCSLCLCVYLGLNGSKIAWKSGKYRSFERFKKSQHYWALGGCIWFAINVLGSIYLLNYSLSLI